MSGDAFLARVLDDGEAFRRMDLVTGELSSSAPWVRAAAAQNERKRRGDSADVTLQRLQQVLARLEALYSHCTRTYTLAPLIPTPQVLSKVDVAETLCRSLLLLHLSVIEAEKS